MDINYPIMSIRVILYASSMIVELHATSIARVNGPLIARYIKSVVSHDLACVNQLLIQWQATISNLHASNVTRGKLAE